MWKSNLSKGFFFLTLIVLLPAGYSLSQEKGVASGAQSPAEKSGAPSIKLSETRFEAGKVNEGTVLVHDFEFVNAGDGTLQITDLVPA